MLVLIGHWSFPISSEFASLWNNIGTLDYWFMFNKRYTGICVCGQTYLLHGKYMVSSNHIQTINDQRIWSKRNEDVVYHVYKLWYWVMDTSFSELRLKVFYLFSWLLKYTMRRVIRAGTMVEIELFWKGIFTPDLIHSAEFLIIF